MADEPRGTVLVTGASRGIGLETARELARRGYRVAMTARDPERLRQAADAVGGDHVAAIPCDVANADSVAAAVVRIREAFGPVGAVVNNAGVIEPFGRLGDVRPDAFDRILSINVAGVYNVCRAVLPDMLSAGAGTIVNLSSGTAHRPIPQWGAYCITKAALAMLTRSLHEDYAADGIRVYGFVPGMVETDLLMGARAAVDNEVSAVDERLLLTPDLPARCIGWIVENAPADRAGEELTIRDPALRAAVGLPERERW